MTATERLASHGASIAATRFVEADGDMLELELTQGDPVLLQLVLAEVFAPADLLVAAGDIKPPNLLVSDMDSTIIGQECIDELADYAGLKAQVAAITERAMRGELDFRNALQQRVALLAGLPETAIAECLEERIEPNGGARELMDALKRHGCRTVLVTGGFHQFADPLAGDLGFDRVVANRLAALNGTLTGELLDPICDAGTKAQVVLEERERLGPGAVVLALGDGANDAAMLRAADYGIAFHAKPAARKVATGSISRGNLSSILRLLGGAPSGLLR